MHRHRHHFRRATLGLGSLSFALIAYTFAFGISEDGRFAGRLLPQHLRGEQRWTTITVEQMVRGRSLPAHTNVIIHIPEDVETITRRTLFGRRGERIRYWGYCFPENVERAQENTRRGFPGVLFLSELERREREQQRKEMREQNFSMFRQVNDENLNQTRELRGTIRHQKEVFRGGESCYVMAAEPLPVGIDEDGDTVNAALETEFGSNPQRKDSDGDGILDGLEIFRLGTHPTKRDSDGDGLIDGIEDANRNGRVDPDETNPMQWDTDRDNLCDGLCKVNKGKELRGEDRNLNGIVDDGETDPRREDSDGDGILDEQEYFNCLLEGGQNC